MADCKRPDDMAPAKDHWWEWRDADDKGDWYECYYCGAKGFITHESAWTGITLDLGVKVVV